MKVLHYSDRNSPDFLRLYRDCDILVTTGDLALVDFVGFEDALLKKPAFGVYGNHDSGNYLEFLGITSLHNRVVEYKGLKWGGWQGCLKYKPGSAPMFTEEEAKEFADTFPYVDVLLLHAGPKGMLDDGSDEVHKGSESIRRYVLDKKPKFVFCGHQYEDGFLEVEGVKVFRTYGARIIEV
jgi:Icc-related predicted phosphoesterase